jgi:hypothetical protein
MTGASRDGAGPSVEDESATNEAQLLEERAAEWAGEAVNAIARLLARAREEAEDIWAEARAMHRGD